MPDNEIHYTESTDLGLNFEIFAEELCKVAIQPFSQDDAFSGGALTIGIFGSWGSGKTALMKEVERQIKYARSGSQNYKSVWFNPWKYDGKEDLRNALIQTILRTMASDVREESQRRRKWFELAKRFGQVSSQISMKIANSALEETTGLSPVALFEGCKNIVSIDDGEIDPYLFINNFEEGFKAAVSSYVGEQGKLIIFIDDLDRCLPERALMVLESIKLYLDQPNCVFFLGIDKRSIEYAVRERYKSSMSITGQEYIEKIIRLSFFLPEKSPEKVTRILQNSITSDFPTSNRQLWDLIQCATNSNIRKVKQFIVAFRLLRDIARGINSRHAQSQIDEFDFACLAKILLLQLNFPDFFDALLKNDALLKKFEHVFVEEEDFYKIKRHLLKDADGRKFVNDDNLIRFLINSMSYPSNFSEPDQIRRTLRLLSMTGGF